MKHVCFLLLAAAGLAAQVPGPLPQSSLWNFPSTIVDDQYRELREFYERQIREGAASREAFAGAPLESQRKVLRELTGAIDRPMAPVATRIPLGGTSEYAVTLVSWPFLRMGTMPPTRGSAGTLVRCYGVLLEPKPAIKRPAVIVVSDAITSAADLAGLTGRLPQEQQTARQFALAGYVVFTPFFIQRRAFSEPWLEDRLWLMRLGYQTGHHIVGAELIQIGSILDYLTALPTVNPDRFAIAGQGQGGMTALYAAALDPRLKITISSGYLDDPRPDWEQPEDRMIWKLRTHLSNDQIAALVRPRNLRICHVIDADALSWLTREVHPSPPERLSTEAPAPSMDLEKVSEIANAQFSEWQALFRNLALEAADKVQTRWTADYSSLKAYDRSLAAKREAYFDLIGHYPSPGGPLEAKSV